MSDSATNLAGQVEDLKDTVDSLTQQRDSLQARCDHLKESIASLQGEGENLTEQRDELYYESNSEKYSDVSLSDLVIKGSADTRVVVKGLFEVTFTNLSKGASLELDKYIKQLSNEPRVFVENKMRVCILARTILSFGEIDDPKPMPDDLDEAMAAVEGLNEKIFDIIWKEYLDFTRWIECGLSSQLKN